MANRSPGCFGHYDFAQIAKFAKKRFIEGYDTVSLLQQAKNDTEREEVALVCLLDVEDKYVLDINLKCRHAKNCNVTNCRDKLRKLIENELSHSRN